MNKILNTVEDVEECFDFYLETRDDGSIMTYLSEGRYDENFGRFVSEAREVTFSLPTTIHDIECITGYKPKSHILAGRRMDDVVGKFEQYAYERNLDCSQRTQYLPIFAYLYLSENPEEPCRDSTPPSRASSGDDSSGVSALAAFTFGAMITD